MRGQRELMDKEMPDHQAIGVAGQVIPMEFPPADACLEDRTRPRHGQHRGAEASGIHLAQCFVLWGSL